MLTPALPVEAYVSGYTYSPAGGIFRVRGGIAASVAGRDTIEHPSFLAADPVHSVLYAASEVMDAGAGAGGALTAFKVDRNGLLTRVRTVSTIEGAPVYLSLSRHARALLFVNYCGNHAGWIPLGADGLPSGDARVTLQPGTAPGAGRQDAPHPHSILEQPGTGRVLVTDLGLDCVFVHRWRGERGEEALELQTEIRMPRGSGPRDIAFHPGGDWAFVTGELDSTLHVLTTRTDSIKLAGSVSTLRNGHGTTVNTSAAVRVHSSGRAVYVSNRGADEISVFSFDAASGRLTLAAVVPAGGKTPRHMALTSDGRSLYVANTDSDRVAVFAVEDDGLTVRPTGSISVTAPACVLPMEFPAVQRISEL